jgi:hypothetical protein
MPNAGTHAVVRVARSRPWREPPRHGRPRWLKAAALSLGILLAAATAQWSLAQRSDGPRINVAQSIIAEPDSQTALAIDVGPRDTLPNKSFLRLTGFPRSVSLTEGHAIAPGSWAVPLSALGSLKAIVPAGVSGRNEITISLVGLDGTTLAETRTALVVSAPRILAAPIDPRPPEPKRVAPAPPPPPPPPPTGKAVKVPELSTADKARAERFLALGGRHLEQGNIGAARSFFQLAAEAGLAAGAMKMAATYDPAELSRLEAVAVTPDRNEARKWYERARDLGSREAEERLARLGRY